MKTKKLFFVSAICMAVFLVGCETGLTKDEINKLIDERLEEEKQNGGSENGGGSTTPSTPGQTVSGSHNGHDYVDMGSAGLWATCNVGANKPWEYGNYYAWGETTTKSCYYWTTYKWCNNPIITDYNRGEFNFIKYCNNSSCGYNGFTDTKTVLDPEDDAARVNWGGKWRMPTKEECAALSNKCTWEWTTENGVKGSKVTATNGNTLFLPTASWRYIMDLLYDINEGGYWSSSLGGNCSTCAWMLGERGGAVHDANVCRECGRPVRAVCER